MRPWRRLVDREIERLWADVAEIRDGLVDLDHRQADALRNHLVSREMIAQLHDDFSVLRNDYRGETT